MVREIQQRVVVCVYFWLFTGTLKKTTTFTAHLLHIYKTYILVKLYTQKRNTAKPGLYRKHDKVKDE